MVLSSTYAYSNVEQGGTVFTAGSLQGSATVTSSRDPLFEVGQSFLRSCVNFSERSEASIDLKSHCKLTESPEDGGDEMMMSVYRNQGTAIGESQGDRGRMELIGGTGKYTGLTGQCSYDARYLTPNLGVLMADCNWSKP